MNFFQKPDKIYKEMKTRPIMVFDKDNTLLEFNRLHQRQELVCLTDEIVTAKKYVEKGWIKKRVLSKIILFAPEISLVDLSHPLEVQKNGGLLKHFALFKTVKTLEKNDKLKNIIKSLTNKGFIILKGKSIELQTRVALFVAQPGLKDEILEKVIKTKTYQDTLQNIKNIYPYERKLTTRKKKIEKEKSKFKKLIDLYSVMDEDFSLPENIYHFTDYIPKADFYLLVPHSGLKFIDEMTEKFGPKKILLYEKHFSKTGDFWLKKVDLKGKTVLIIDSVYSGKTLQWISDIIKKQKGIPKRIGIWPKSKMGLKQCEYIIFLDKTIKKKEINPMNKLWAEKLYCKIAFSK